MKKLPAFYETPKDHYREISGKYEETAFWNGAV
jgi:hypothetical protein